MIRFALVLEPRRAIDQQLRRMMLNRHLRNLRLHHLVFRNRLTKLSPLIRVLDRRVDRRPGDAPRSRSTTEAGVVQLPHADLETVASLAEQRILGRLCPVKRHFAGGLVE